MSDQKSHRSCHRKSQTPERHEKKQHVPCIDNPQSYVTITSGDESAKQIRNGFIDVLKQKRNRKKGRKNKKRKLSAEKVMILHKKEDTREKTN